MELLLSVWWQQADLDTYAGLAVMVLIVLMLLVYRQHPSSELGDVEPRERSGEHHS